MSELSGNNLRMRLRLILAAVLGFVVAVVAVTALDTFQYARHSPDASTVAYQQPLTPMTVDPSWIKSGTPEFKATETSRSHDGRSVTGLWSCTGPTTFVWQFGDDETVHLLEGEVKVEYQGKHFTLRPGDTATFHAKTAATWTIDRYAKKVYTLHRLPRGGDVMRMLDS